MNIEMQIKKLYAFDAALCLRITDAVWVLFLLNRGFSLAQVGMAEGIYHVISMFCEVPSGMAADLFGRKRTLVAFRDGIFPVHVPGCRVFGGMCRDGIFRLEP